MTLWKTTFTVIGIVAVGLLLNPYAAFNNRLPRPDAEPDFSIVLIPDSQYYASTYPNIYLAQMQWIAGRKTAGNIVYVASLGDNVDSAGDLKQWANADAAYRILDSVGIPYGIAAGNHDGAPSDTGNFNAYFGEARFSNRPYYGGHYGNDNDNSYALFEAGSLKFIFIFIEYDDEMISTSHPVLAWANSLLQVYHDRRAMVISHNMLEGGTSNAFSTQGETIYHALKANPNLFLIMGGHLDIAARRQDTYNGNTIHTLRSDYQFVDNYQSGYLRILRFSPADNTITVNTYSPTQEKYHPDRTDNNFNLPYDMSADSSVDIGRIIPLTISH